MKNEIFKIAVFGMYLFVFSSCSSLKESTYNSEYPLSSERVKSVSKNFSVQIPYGWFATVDNSDHSFELWLNNKDYSAAITFINILTDEKLLQGENELKDLLNYSKIVKKAELGKNYSELNYEEYFELHNLPCAAMVFLNKNNKKGRIVVFEFRGHYYESTATILNDDLMDEDDLFVIQNSIIKSIY